MSVLHILLHVLSLPASVQAPAASAPAPDAGGDLLPDAAEPGARLAEGLEEVMKAGAGSADASAKRVVDLWNAAE